MNFFIKGEKDSLRKVWYFFAFFEFLYLAWEKGSLFCQKIALKAFLITHLKFKVCNFRIKILKPL